MKKLLLFGLISLLAINLSARMNPFEPTDTFFEQQKEYELKQKQEEEKQLELEKQRKLELLAQQEVEEKAEQLRLQQEQEAQLEKQRQLEAQKAAQMIKVVEKKEKEIIVPKDSYKILPFVHIKVSEEGLEVFIDKRYKLVNQDILEDQNKFLFDFRATESFYTVRKTLDSKDFKSFAVGTHMEKNFFRVVVELTDSVSKYKEYINSNTSYINIKKIK